MLPSVTVLGSSALLNWMIDGPAADRGVDDVGAVTSARVKEIGPEATRSLPSSETTTGPLAGLWTEKRIAAVGDDAGSLGEADGEVDDRRVGGVVDGDRGADVDCHSCRGTR